MAQADAEHRQLLVQEGARGVDGVVAGLGIARAVGQKHAVRIQLEDFLGAGLGRHQGDAAAAVGQQAQDVALDAEVVGDDVELGLVRLGEARAQLPGAFGPVEAVLDGDDAGQVHAGHAGEAAGQVDGAFGVGADEDAGALGALFTQDAGELAGIHARNGDDALLGKVLRQRLRGTEVRHAGGTVADHQAGGIDAIGFHVLGVDAGIADVRIGQRNDLAAVAGIGEYFLVPGHRGVEHHLGNGMPRRTDRHASKNGTVRQSQNCRREAVDPLGKKLRQHSKPRF
ncbi:hypothetical protein D9M68_543150 [compost metagenome]